jgi:hypothetical protein
VARTEAVWGKILVPNWVIIVVCVVILYGLVHGLLMLVSPAKHRRFNLRVSDPFGTLKLRPPDHDPDPGLELEYRLAGLALAVVCSLIAWGSLDSLLGRHHGESLRQHGATPTIIAFGKNWWGFVAATGCFAFGMYAFLRPLSVHQWSTKPLLSSSQLPPEPTQIRLGMRFLGACFMALGVILFWLAVKQN